MLLALVLAFVVFLFFAGGWLWLLLLFVVFVAVQLVRSFASSGTGVVAVSRRIQSLAEVSNFTDAVIAVRANATLSAQQKLTELAVQYSESLRRLDAAGHLTPAVALEFRLFAERTAQTITGLTVDFGAGLHDLIHLYEPRRDDRF
jgi:hypothetical protein